MEDDFQSASKPVAPKPMTAPVMDIKPPATSASDNRPPQPAHQAEPLVNHTKDQPPTKTKQPNNGSSAAIVATVIIVIVLATLATYAYLKTAK